MHRCSYDLITSSVSKDAQQAFQQAVFGLAAHRPSTGAALQAAISADPDHVAAHALKGFANLILARSELLPNAEAALADARMALVRADGGTEDERIFVGALEDAVGGSFSSAIDALDEGFAGRPAAFLPFKLSHSLRFMIGDGAGMLATSARAADGIDRVDPMAGFVLGCHAFSLEEAGRYDEAMSAGLDAVSLEPNDSWGLHAVSHVFEMRGQTEDGINWLEDSRPAWSRCNNFSFHMAWHLALLHLEQGEHERVLQIYDDEVRPQQTDDFRDMANAVSLLWRLNQVGVHVGSRWVELADIARSRRQDTTLIFAALHNLAALVAVGDRAAATELVMQIETKALSSGDQGRVAAEIGMPMARILTGMSAPADRQMLDRMMINLNKVGGSNAQRDFFVLALAKAAGGGGNTAGVSRIRHMRRHLKAEDRLIRSIEKAASPRMSA
jgi:tetratricopeptide (TPR) repeat protein